ncbi:hypothetical protein FDI14_gp043 [Mycobacterium phage SirDuracell]|uniref:Uncharacterized protein n=1 Tax=Mycobacterium phage SirDuracell TaxID=1034116 RepID=G1D5Q8_9CAUD|nr:hypothetical protein FDI14_gp043 [Mycobacterium phage SirDuracell]AEK10108.1 hypothetical protein PBI_SIRDURACELL_43 [Mycobacterium phage SirDuracell]
MNETERKAFDQIIAASYSPAELRKLYRDRAENGVSDE